MFVLLLWSDFLGKDFFAGGEQEESGTRTEQMVRRVGDNVGGRVYVQ